MRDWKAVQLRYLVHFADCGSGMRSYDEPLDVGAELRDGPQRYVVERVEQPPTRTPSATPGRSWPSRHVWCTHLAAMPWPF